MQEKFTRMHADVSGCMFVGTKLFLCSLIIFVSCWKRTAQVHPAPSRTSAVLYAARRHSILANYIWLGKPPVERPIKTRPGKQLLTSRWAACVCVCECSSVRRRVRRRKWLIARINNRVQAWEEFTRKHKDVWASTGYKITDATPAVNLRPVPHQIIHR